MSGGDKWLYAVTVQIHGSLDLTAEVFALSKEDARAKVRRELELHLSGDRFSIVSTVNLNTGE
jgi:hypothetical protein